MQRIHRNVASLTAEAKKLATNQRVALGVSLFDAVVLGTIFAMFLNEDGREFLEKHAKYPLFSAAAGASVAQAGIKWWEAYIKDDNTRAIVDAFIETAAALGISTAVVGALGFKEVFAKVTPIMFASILGSKTLWNSGSALYYLKQGVSADDEETKATLYGAAKELGIASAAGVAATVAVIGVFVLSEFGFAGIGVAVAMFAASLAIYKGIQMCCCQEDNLKVVEVTESDSLAGGDLESGGHRLSYGTGKPAAVTPVNASGLQTLGSFAPKAAAKPDAQEEKRNLLRSSV